MISINGWVLVDIDLMGVYFIFVFEPMIPFNVQIITLNAILSNTTASYNGTMKYVIIKLSTRERHESGKY